MHPREFIRSRRSLRRFNPEPIDDAAIEQMLLTATSAPSAHNRQPWRFCVIRHSDVKARLADAMGAEFRRDLLRDNLPAADIERRVATSEERINSSPLVIVLCMDVSEMDIYPDAPRAEAERMMAIQSTAAAGAYLLLAVHAEGLSGVWTCGPLFAPDTVRGVLGLDAHWEPQAMFFIGHADQTPRPKEMKPLESVVRWL
jgi:F420 biosynthesis protein FbiB-like protein